MTSLPSQMKAIVQPAYGGPDVLEYRDVARPVPTARQVLIKIHASSATAADGMMREGFPVVGRLFMGLTQPKRAIPGCNLAGTVVEVGAQVTRFQVGDEVYGQTLELGCYAEYVCEDEGGVLDLKPANISFAEAAPVCDGASTAMNFLRDIAKLQPGQRVLIYGASGGVGSAAVQIARSYGARVTGVCSTRNIEMVKAQGAHRVIDYTTEDFAASGETYDVIFDAVGKSSFAKCRPVLAERGVYLSAVLSLPLLFQILWTSMFGAQKARFSATGTRSTAERQSYLSELTELLSDGRVSTVLDRDYPLSQMAEAHRYVDTGRKAGNVVITVS